MTENEQHLLNIELLNAIYANKSNDDIKEIIAKGANVNASAGENGVTPIMVATSVEQTRALFEAGADPLKRDNLGFNAFQYTEYLMEIAEKTNDNPKIYELAGKHAFLISAELKRLQNEGMEKKSAIEFLHKENDSKNTQNPQTHRKAEVEKRLANVKNLLNGLKGDRDMEDLVKNEPQKDKPLPTYLANNQFRNRKVR